MNDPKKARKLMAQRTKLLHQSLHDIIAHGIDPHRRNAVQRCRLQIDDNEASLRIACNNLRHETRRCDTQRASHGETKIRLQQQIEAKSKFKVPASRVEEFFSNRHKTQHCHTRSRAVGISTAIAKVSTPSKSTTYHLLSAKGLLRCRCNTKDQSFCRVENCRRADKQKVVFTALHNAPKSPGKTQYLH